MAERRRDRLAQVAKRRQEDQVAKQTEREQLDEAFGRDTKMIGSKPLKPGQPERGQVE